MNFDSTGSPGRLGDIHLDMIEQLSAPSVYERTTTALEDGAPINVHRRRVARRLSVRVRISDVAPNVLALRWELRHAEKTRARVEELQASGEEVEFFDGQSIWVTPTGSRVWVVDEIDHEDTGIAKGLWLATITLGEVPRYTVAFNEISTDVNAADADSVDGISDKGLQSTETVPTSVAATVVLS